MGKTPEQMREELLASLDRPIIRALDSEGITDELLAKKLKDELDATETKVFQYKGGTVEKSDLVTWEVRQRARIDAHKLRGDYPSEKHHVTFEGELTARALTPEEELELEARKQILKEQAMRKALKGE